MAKSLRSSIKKKHKRERTVKFAAREKDKLIQMVERAKQSEDVKIKTATEIKENAMDTRTKSEYDPKTMKNAEGKYAPWVSMKLRKKMQKEAKKSNTFKKKNQKTKKLKKMLRVEPGPR